jgi:diguanylate cyclase (GGDEF)-like protein
VNKPIQITEALIRGQTIRIRNALKFDPELELPYREFHRARHLMPRILTAAMVGILTLLSPFYEYLLDAPAGYSSQAFFIQSITMLIPTMCVILIMLTEQGKRHAELGISFIVLFVCMGMLAERRVGLEYGFVIPFAFPTAVIAFAFVAFRLRFFTFLPFAVLAAVLHSINELSLSQALTPTFYNVVFIWFMFGFGAASGYNSEVRERENWLNNQLLIIKSNADHLTQLANKRSFDRHLESVYLLARRARKPLALLVADIDHFKEYNDQYGHQRGDQCLTEVASIIASVSRRHADLAARIGGEEFAIVLYDTDGTEALRLANELQTAIHVAAIPHLSSPLTKQITISIGGSWCTPGPEFTEPLLVADADKRLYAAKNSGRNRIDIGELI